MFEDGIKKLLITCKQDGMWHPNPIYLKCVELECSIPSPVPENGFVLGDHFVLGAEVTIQCYDGYFISSENGEIETSTGIKCGATLQWEPIPSAITCKREFFTITYYVIMICNLIDRGCQVRVLIVAVTNNRH